MKLNHIEAVKQLHQAHMKIENTKWRAKATFFGRKIENMLKKCIPVNQIRGSSNVNQWQQMMYVSVHFKWLDQIYLKGMVKTFNW